MVEACSRTIGQLNVCFPATLEQIDLICIKVKALLADLDLTQQSFAAVLLAREMLVNAVVHGSRSDPRKQVRFHLHREGDKLVMEVEDQGPGFNWRQRANREAELSDECGRGMMIFRAYAEDMTFNSKGNKMTLRTSVAH